MSSIIKFTKHIFVFMFIFFCFYFFTNFASATSWPTDYGTPASTDSQTDGLNNTMIRSGQLDMNYFYTVNNSGVNGYPAGFYVKIQLNNIRYINKGNCYEFHWNATSTNIFYKVSLFTTVASEPGNAAKQGTYTITFWKSIDREANWTKLVEYPDIKSEDWNATSTSLGYKVVSSNNGSVEMRINESLFASTTTIYNVYAKTTFGSTHIYADVNPNSGYFSYTFAYNGFTGAWPKKNIYDSFPGKNPDPTLDKNIYDSFPGKNPDPTLDQYVIPAVQQEIFAGYMTDTFNDIFFRAQLHTVVIPAAVGMNTEVYFNPSIPKYSNIWYMFKTEYADPGPPQKWDLWLRRSTDRGSTWTNLENHLGVRLTNGIYDSGTLGLKVTVGTGSTTPGYIEWYTKKQYIEEPVDHFNIYYLTRYGNEGEVVDRCPDSGGPVGPTFNEPISQATFDPPNLAPAEADQGETNVPMTIITASTTVGVVEWTGLRIDKTSSSTMQDADVAGIKIWKDDGDQIFETDQDMVVADKQNPFSSGTANIIFNPTQILTGTNSYYFINYDINWFAGLDRTVGMYIGDKTYFTVSAPANVSIEYFPFIAGNSKITPAAYLSFNISGVDENINTEGETTDISTGGSGWIDFGSLTPNLSIVAGQKLNIMTNSATGYKVTIQENNNLTNLENNNTVPDISGTNAVPSVWPSAGGFGYHTSDDLLSSGITNRFLPDNTYASVTNAPEEVAYKNSATTENGDAIDIVYKLEIDSLQEVGRYVNIITYTCTTMY